MKRAVVFVLPALLAGCAGALFTPLEGMPAALGESVIVVPDALVATPRRVIEDSRCPLTVRCVQAGRVVVSTRLDGVDWNETVPLTLGEPYSVMGHTITLVSARPEKWNERRRPRSEYRFIFEGT
jgi:hypothetical protein